MNVVYFLHKHGFTRYRKQIVMVVPKGITVLPFPRYVAQLLEGGIMAARFQMVNNPSAYDSIDILKHFGGLQDGISNYVQVIGHEYVCV